MDEPADPRITERVAAWISGDKQNIGQARTWLMMGVDAMAHGLTSRLKNAKPYSAPWGVAQELAPDDYARINWNDVADEIIDVADKIIEE